MVGGSRKNEYERRILASGIWPLEHEELLAVLSGLPTTHKMQKWSTYHFEKDCILPFGTACPNSVTAQAEQWKWVSSRLAAL